MSCYSHWLASYKPQCCMKFFPGLQKMKLLQAGGRSWSAEFLIL